MSDEAAADFARRFAEYWRAPTPQGLDTVLAERVRLVAPMTPVTHTLAEGRRAFAELFELISGMTAEVHRWGATADGVLIEFTLSGIAGGRPISWPAIDRFVLGDDGLATERVSYFDSAPIALAAARRPRAWPAFLRSRLRQLRR
ncbi:MAG TPA: nuclear transport factor 2 family protein [Solirubrobacterales bacterium]|nr:nuclear transport factor 2 family protein [Solirubrobacterales bacterium]